jgi:hypothetical protein
LLNTVIATDYQDKCNNLVKEEVLVAIETKKPLLRFHKSGFFTSLQNLKSGAI